jgi:hypothetical protein
MFERALGIDSYHFAARRALEAMPQPTSTGKTNELRRLLAKLGFGKS